MKTDIRSTGKSISSRKRIVALLCAAAMLLGVSLSACSRPTDSPDEGASMTDASTTETQPTVSTKVPFPENRVVPDVFEGLVYRKPGTQLIIDSTYAPDYEGEPNTVEFFGRDELVERPDGYPQNISDEMAFWLEREKADDTLFRVEMAYSPYELLNTVEVNGRSLTDMFIEEVQNRWQTDNEEAIALHRKIRETQIALVTKKYQFIDLDCDPFATYYSARFTATLSRSEILEMAADEDLHFLHIGFLKRPDGTPERISTELMYKLLEMEENDTLRIRYIQCEYGYQQPEEGVWDSYRYPIGEEGPPWDPETDQDGFILECELLPTAIWWGYSFTIEENEYLHSALNAALAAAGIEHTSLYDVLKSPPIECNYFFGFSQTMTKQEILSLLDKSYVRYIFLSEPQDNNFLNYHINF